MTHTENEVVRIARDLAAKVYQTRWSKLTFGQQADLMNEAQAE